MYLYIALEFISHIGMLYLQLINHIKVCLHISFATVVLFKSNHYEMHNSGNYAEYCDCSLPLTESTE